MPSSQAAGADRRNERMITHEPPKLKTTLKTPPKQATNPLQFVKVGPCSLYRTAQEQLQKVQEVKKIKQEIRDDPEDWQSNLDNWKSSRRKRQEHIIERVVEVKKLELEEHDRQRRRSKTFSEMMEERGNRGRKLSISLAMYHEEDANDLSDLGIGTSSGKSSISGDTHDSHDDMHSVLSDKDSEIEKNHSDLDQVSNTRINDDSTTVTTTTSTSTTVFTETITSSASTTITTTATITTSTKNQPFGNGYGNHEQEYDSAITATASSPEPEEYTYEGAIRGYVSRVSQNIPRRTLAGLDAKLEESKASAEEENKSNSGPAVKIDIVKRREIFEKASQRSNTEGKLSNRLSGDFTGAKSIKERLSSLEKQKQQESNEKLEKSEKNQGQSMNRLSGDMSSIRERLSHLEKERSERENRVSARRKISGAGAASSAGQETKHTEEMTARSIKDRLNVLDVARGKESSQEKRPPVGKHGLCYRDHEMRVDASTPSERSSSPDSEYRVSRAAFHRSLDSLDADASSGPDTFERVQSLEELDYTRRYPASSSSAELLNDTDREDSGIHTADVSCSVSQADEPVDEDIVHASALVERRHQEVIHEEKPFTRENKDANRSPTEDHNTATNDIATPNKNESFASQREANVVTNKGTTETSSSSSGELTTNKPYAQTHSLVEASSNPTTRQSHSTSNRPIVYQSPKVPPRRTPPETPPKPKSLLDAGKLPIYKESGFQTDNTQRAANVETQNNDSTTAERDEESPLRMTSRVPPEQESLQEISKPDSFDCEDKEDRGDASSLEKDPFAGRNEEMEEESDEDARIGTTISTAEVGNFVGEESSCFDLFVNNVSATCPASPSCTFVPASLSFYSSTSANVTEATSPISSSDSTCTVQEITKVSAGRSASKIPTPLQRKGSNGKATPATSNVSTNSPTTSSSVPRTLSPKTRSLTEKRTVSQSVNLHGSPKLSEIPIFIGSNVTAHLSAANETPDVSPLKSPCASSFIDPSPKSLDPQSSPSSPPSLSKIAQGSAVQSHVPPKNHQASSIPTICAKKPQGISTPSNFSKVFPEPSAVPSASSSAIGESPATVPPCSPSAATSETAEQPFEKRRTVVEVCTKVVVPRGETLPVPPVTPFITVERVGDERDDTEEQDTIAQVIGEEVVAICQVNAPVEPSVELEMVANVETEPSELKKHEEEKYSAVHEPALSSTATSTTAPMTFERLPVADNYPAKETGTMDNGPTVVTEVTNIRESSTPILKQIPPLILSTDEEILADIVFPLGPPTSIEPPKEKPPPPPVDLSDEENHRVEPLKRLNSTRRLKKELRSRRSDFLGLEGVNDDELERELSVAKPPDMAAILAEERRVEHLHRHSYDTDSNYEQDSSHERDSGVELGHAEDWTKQPVSPDMSQHSRQSSEPFGASVTSSEEDEITKKEREIIEVLEKEEQWRYGNDRDLDSELGEKLAHKLRELEVEKMQLERERAHVAVLRHQEETFRKNADNARTQDEMKCKQPEDLPRVKTIEAKHGNPEIEEELRIQAEQLRIQSDVQENHRRTADARRNDDICNRPTANHGREEENKAFIDGNLNEHDEEFVSGEVLRVERELLQLEQEELKRQRTNLAYREQKQMQLEENLQEQWKSLQDVAHCSVNNVQRYKTQPLINYRSSMPNLQLQDGYRRRAPPPPIPPAKPLRLVDQQHRDVTVRNSRIPSADSIPQQVDDSSLRYSASTTSLSCHVGHQMSRQTLQALSAVPRTRIVQSDQWVQRRRSDIPRGAHDYNYQHWLVQEAEQRRINEKNQRTPVRKQQHMTGTSVPYTTVPAKSDSKPLPDSIIQTLTQRVQNRVQDKPIPLRKRLEHSTSQEHLSPIQQQQQQQQKAQRPTATNNHDNQEKMLSVSGKKKCSHCGDELGRGAAMIIESLRLFYHMECFKCCVCHVRLGDGLMGTDVRVRNHKLHCHNCYSSDDGVKFSCV